MRRQDKDIRLRPCGAKTLIGIIIILITFGFAPTWGATEASLSGVRKLAVGIQKASEIIIEAAYDNTETFNQKEDDWVKRIEKSNKKTPEAYEVVQEEPEQEEAAQEDMPKIFFGEAELIYEEEVPEVVPQGEYQSYAYSYFASYGWIDYDFECLVALWNSESGWNPYAENPSSGAYGIPQSLPASKMASFGDDYLTNGYTQIRWGLDYIARRYGTPANAWAHSEKTGWY